MYEKEPRFATLAVWSKATAGEVRGRAGKVEVPWTRAVVGANVAELVPAVYGAGRR